MNGVGTVFNLIQSLVDKGEKALALLIDPDKADEKSLMERIDLAVSAGVKYILVGGSLLNGNELDHVIKTIKSNCHIPVIIFPGSPLQINPNADAILLLSLISGRNPQLLIGDHVISAPYLKKSGLEILSTGYMLVGSDRSTTAAYISQSIPLPENKPEIAQCTAMAGEMLGMSLLYLDAGSGASKPVDSGVIKAVKKSTDTPLIVGGGINSASMANEAFSAGADILVVGNAIEKNPSLIAEISSQIKELNSLNATT